MPITFWDKYASQFEGLSETEKWRLAARIMLPYLEPELYAKPDVDGVCYGCNQKVPCKCWLQAVRNTARAKEDEVQMAKEREALLRLADEYDSGPLPYCMMCERLGKALFMGIPVSIDLYAARIREIADALYPENKHRILFKGKYNDGHPE